MELKIAKPTKYADSKIFNKESGYNYFQRGDDFYLDGEATEQELLDAFAAHNPTAPTQATVSDKLAAIGITAEDLKALLS
tara:strand:- start:233 stop:472 length:240 start_codon:yes stop_codon:yes gene_type:complete